ncbi:protein kinase domain-containing protein [Sorangium sp. So ce341]|uniref:serine/threonine-protein kinase n=1 Tax=Sorangium sp. So ce341 TaxID=3133302 RepID=UPI003F628281
MGTLAGLGHGGATKVTGVLQPPAPDRRSDPTARDIARDAATLSAQQPQPAQPSPAAPRGAGRDGTRAKLQPGRLVAGRYKLAHPLGHGAMGEVWRAHDGVRRFDVALKFLVLPRQSLPIDAMERFRFEAQVAAQLGRKTDLIVTVHDAGEDPAVGPYLVMEYVRGRSLRQLIQERGPVPAAELAALLSQIGEALSVAHGLGIVHRDIKPSNILLREGRDGRLRAKVADFGIAKWIRQDLPADFPRQTAEGVVLGTPAYLSPEHTCDGHADPQLDMWALAVVAHVALTGHQPFAGGTIADVLASILAGERPSLSTLAPEAPPELEAWFARAFALNPEERFPAIKPMVSAFVAAVGASDAAPISVAPASVAPASVAPASVAPASVGPASVGRAAPPRRPRGRLAAAGLVAALGMGMALATALPRAQLQSPSAVLREVGGEVRAVARRAPAVQTSRAPQAGACSAVPPAAFVAAPLATGPQAAPLAAAAAPEPAPPPAVAAAPEPTPRPATAAAPEPAPRPAAARPARASEAPRSTGGALPRQRTTDSGARKSAIF